jgi:hypothetical protein
MKRLITRAAVLVVLSTAAFAQFETDHFKCYLPNATSTIPTQSVQLSDQFSSNTARVRNIWRFCNPTMKNHVGVITPITNPDAHLALHIASPQPLVNRQVVIRNQFGVSTIITGPAKFLAVPTQKEPHGPPFNLDHFNCYTATSGAAANAVVALGDQWFASEHKVGGPILFCNPVKKIHNKVVTPILHPRDHLTCYKIKDRLAWYDAMDDESRWKVQEFFWSTIARTCAKSPARRS